MRKLHEFIGGVLTEEGVRVAVSGDVMFGRFVGKEYHPLGIDDPLRGVKTVFEDADLSIVNLETPLFDGEPTWWKKYPLPEGYQRTLVAPTERVHDLAGGSINFVSLANNHTDDAGFEGFSSTVETLESAGIQHSGVSLDGDPFFPKILIVKGKPIAFFSVTLKRNFGLDWGDRSEYPPPLAHISDSKDYNHFLKMIEETKRRFPEAFIFVSMHWGVQYRSTIEPWQEILARDIVDSGANCILGHHPHVLQKVSVYNGSIIFYSLGNLLFDHNYDIPGHASKENSDTQNGAIYKFMIGADNAISSLEKVKTISTPTGVIVSSQLSEGSRIVPTSMSMSEWESYKKKNKTTAKAYDKKTKTKWKITHGPGHKDAGKTIKGNTGLTYKKAKSIQNAFGGW